MVAATVALVLLWRPMLWTFRASDAMCACGAHVFWQMALGLASCGAANTLALCCTAVGDGRVLMVASYLRQILVPVPVFLLLRSLFGLDWACLGFAAGDMCAALYAWSRWKVLSRS